MGCDVSRGLPQVVFEIDGLLAASLASLEPLTQLLTSQKPCLASSLATLILGAERVGLGACTGVADDAPDRRGAVLEDAWAPLAAVDAETRAESLSSCHFHLAWLLDGGPWKPGRQMIRHE